MSNIQNYTKNQQVELSIKDKSNPRSLINLVPTVMEQALMAVPDELMEMPEEELRKKSKPDATDEFIKLSFWDEYDRAQARGVKLDLVNVYVRACSRDYFYKKFLGNSHKVAWLLTPPAQYEVALNAILARGLQRLHEIVNMPLEQPVYDKEGKYCGTKHDANIAKTIAQVVKDVDIRVNGAIPQFVNTKSTNVNVNVNRDDSMREIPSNVTDIDAQIRALEGRMPQDVIDVSGDE
jgi:hypothetical protein